MRITTALRAALRASAAVAVVAMMAASATDVRAEYDVGVTDTTITLGNTNPYSGPASAYGTVGRGLSAYFDMINANGGVNGRQIEFITLDDGYSPPKTVEQVRRLVEQDEVFALFQTLGTPTNSAIHHYVNARKVPHLFVATGASKWGQPEDYPWTMGFQPTYTHEGAIYARYLLEHVADPKIGILYQNDDYGKDYVDGFRAGLGDLADQLIIAEEPYEVTDPTIDSQIVGLQNSGANVFFNVTTPKFAAQAIRKAYDIGWHPLHFLNNVSASVDSVLTPAGLEKATGLITAGFMKDPTDPQWAEDEEYKAWVEWMDTYYEDGNKAELFNVYAYAVGGLMVEVLRRCGDDLTRENLMLQAASLDAMRVPMLWPGITLTTGPDDFYPIESLQLLEFDGQVWQSFGEVINAEDVIRGELSN